MIGHIAGKLNEAESAYAGLFDALLTLSPVRSEPLQAPPIRDMDEMLETFGPGADGVEPLLKPTMPAIARSISIRAARAPETLTLLPGAGEGRRAALTPRHRETKHGLPA
ncbi:Uncharacterised protein [Chromobacterium violaceum]|uniref:Uncharacterized protein n=1 Tax=Chromobacterium violaceum TaxID=536 RepID=A0A447TEG0_CHRVL|nr:Uncharacterised protein [Chromobacterium violaceum]